MVGGMCRILTFVRFLRASLTIRTFLSLQLSKSTAFTQLLVLAYLLTHEVKPRAQRSMGVVQGRSEGCSEL